MELCLYKQRNPVVNRLKYVIARSISKAAYKLEDSGISKESVNQKAEYILDNYGNAILRLAYSYLHNMSDAEDILQDTLIKYIQVKPYLENPAHEKAWLLKVAANMAKNRIEYNLIRKSDELNEELVSEEREDLSFVWEAVKSLPVKYRETIHLFYQEGYSTRDISRILGRNESSIRSDLKRGRDRLKLILKEAYDFERVI
ncbi:MAG: RNA polymerase sigma factor [Lachnospira sp.]